MLLNVQEAGLKRILSPINWETVNIMCRHLYCYFRAIEEDYKSIRSFYNHVIDNTKGIEKYARWIKGMHPSDSIIGVKREVDQNVIH